LSSSIIELKPVNRHLLIVPHFHQKEEKTESGIFLPEDSNKREVSRHIVATVVDVASDCNESFRKLRKGNLPENRRDIIIDSTMIEEVPYRGKNFYLILENYVTGLLGE